MLTLSLLTAQTSGKIRAPSGSVGLGVTIWISTSVELGAFTAWNPSLDSVVQDVRRELMIIPDAICIPSAHSLGTVASWSSGTRVAAAAAVAVAVAVVGGRTTSVLRTTEGGLAHPSNRPTPSTDHRAS